MAKFSDVKVVIMRANPFHNGHAHLLEEALFSSTLTIVLIGSSHRSRSLKNPFTFAERKQMIEGWYLSHTDTQKFGELIIRPIKDYASDNEWIAEAQQIVNNTVRAHCTAEIAKGNPLLLTNIQLLGSDRDDSTWYLHAFPQWKPILLDPKHHVPADGTDLSATSVRKVLYESTTPKLFHNLDFNSLSYKLPASTRLFLKNFIQSGKLTALREEYRFIQAYKKSWALAPYAPTFVTTDAAVIQSGHILVVKRGAQPGKGLWALPGGFVNQNERIQAAAVRETMEETGILLADGKKAKEITKAILTGSIVGKEIFDDPDRSARGRTVTTLFVLKLDDTKPLPKVKGQNVPAYESGGKDIVETEDAFWLPFDRALTETDKWFEDHSQLAAFAINFQAKR